MIGLEFVGISGVGLVVEETAALVDQLVKFPSLKRLDVSANPGLGCVGAAAFLSALSGMLSSSRPYSLRCNI